MVETPRPEKNGLQVVCSKGVHLKWGPTKEDPWKWGGLAMVKKTNNQWKMQTLEDKTWGLQGGQWEHIKNADKGGASSDPQRKEGEGA